MSALDPESIINSQLFVIANFLRGRFWGLSFYVCGSRINNYTKVAIFIRRKTQDFTTTFFTRNCSYAVIWKLSPSCIIRVDYSYHVDLIDLRIIAKLENICNKLNIWPKMTFYFPISYHSCVPEGVFSVYWFCN